MKKLVAAFVAWYLKGRRHWLAALLGPLVALAFPPFNHQTHFAFAPFPFLGLVAFVPLFCFAVQRSLAKSILDVYLFSVTACFAQYYWVAGVAAEGLRHIIIMGAFAQSLFLALYSLAAGIVFRAALRRFPRFYILVFPSAWVLIEFVRGWGELSFPWNYLGYVFVPILALAQLSSVCGVLGLSFIAIAGNILVWELLRSYLRGADISQKWLHIAVFAAFLAVSAGWGFLRLSRALPDAPAVTVSLVQANMDQARWGDGSLDTCMDISGAMVCEAAKQRPGLIILAESALFCYLVHRPWTVGQVRSWSDSTHSPIITGSLHWDRSRDSRGNFEYAVYNTAFFIDTGGREFEPYFKIRLLPFSEAMPFETQIPLLNRLNLGEADFSRGSEEKVFRIGRDIRAGPFICFEIVFPDFVRRRVLKGANLLVNITNDGWWGRSNGPYHHASMARMRCIENGVPLARCANSGVSMAVDQYGRVLGRTRLGERTVLTRSVSLASVPTVYRRFGDWVLLVALFFVAEAVMVVAVEFFSFRRSRKASLSSKEEGGTGSPQ